MSLLEPIAACALVFAAATQALGQGQGQGVTVSVWECYDNCVHPHDVDPCCTPGWASATCTRFDSGPVIVNPGTLVVFPDPSFEFECANCCKFKPDDCEGNAANPDPRECSLSPAISWTESITLTVSSSVTVDVAGVKAMLQAGVGVVQGMETSVSLTCPLSTPKCKSTACHLAIKYLDDRTARVDHTWQANGVWKNYPSGVGCTTGICPIAGSPWIVGPNGCWENSSFATVDDLKSAACGSPYLKECPPRVPCN